MHPQKVQVKIFALEQPTVVGYVSVFQRWIRDHALDELLIDVVDYSHVANGPEVVLIGHESDYALDRGEGRLGLLYTNKRASESNDGVFRDALRRAVNACRLLQDESETASPLTFGTSELLIRIVDRLSAPNTDETFEHIAPALREALAHFYEDTPFTLARHGSPRELFSVTVRAPMHGAVHNATAEDHIDSANACREAATSPTLLSNRLAINNENS